MSDVIWKYIGKGHWITGIPKRDLSKEDLLDFNIDEHILKQSGLYIKTEKQKEVKIESELSKKGKED